MALARFDMARKTVTLASIGNIEIRLLGAEKFSPVIRRGIVGVNTPNAVSTDHGWARDSILVMHSDGLNTRWQWEEFRALLSETPGAIANRLLSDLGKIDDDATVVCVKNTAGALG
jgi:serine/threonine protein phosphatase PrpC